MSPLGDILFYISSPEALRDIIQDRSYLVPAGRSFPRFAQPAYPYPEHRDVICPLQGCRPGWLVVLLLIQTGDNYEHLHKQGSKR